MNVIGESVRQRLAEIDTELPAFEAALITLKSNVKDMRAEKRDLERVVRQLNPPSDRKPVVSDEQVLLAVMDLNDGRVDRSEFGLPRSDEVSGYLGVEPRNVARKLRKLVDDGKLIGDATNGFQLVSA